MKKTFVTLFLLIFLAMPCFSAEFTLGMVQQSLREGMSQADVVSCIGSPNLITKNSAGCEIWVYDKKSHSTLETYHRSWVFLFLTGRRKGCKRVESSEKSLTVILNFNQNACLESYSYNTSSY